MSLFQPPDMANIYPQGVQQYQNGPAPYIPSMPVPQSAVPSDGSVMSPQDDAGAAMPMLDGVPAVNSASPATPVYVGNPVIDKYIHAFIGS